MLPLPNHREDAHLVGTPRRVPPVGGANLANAGLVWDKFVNGWSMNGNQEFGLHALNGGKGDWVGKFCGGGHGNESHLKAQCGRVRDLALFTAKSSLAAEPAEHPRTLTLTSRLVTGLGLTHPVENGFAWHHTLGVPYLPGSGVKGMMRAWATLWCGPEEAGDIVHLFGNEVNSPARMGALIVFDALPVAPVQLVHEVVTPHDGGWRLKGPVVNEKTGIVLSPGDWHDPVPSPFLAVDIGAQFQFALGLTRRGKAGDLELGYELLTGALEWVGAGAKTATGFGRFEDKSKVFARNRKVAVAENAGGKLAGRQGHIIADVPLNGLWKVKLGDPEAPGATEAYVAAANLTFRD